MSSQNHIEETIDALLSQHQDEKLSSYLSQLSIDTIGRVINHVTHGKKKIFRLLTKKNQQHVIWNLNLYSRKYIITALPHEKIHDLIEDMDSDDASDIVYLLPHFRRNRILKSLSKKDSQEIEEILTYPPTSAGHIMQKEMIYVPEYFSVLDAIKRVQRLYEEVRHISFIFVIDTKGLYIGYVPVEKLIIAQPRQKMRSLITGNKSVLDSMDQEEVAYIFKQEDLPALPVVNKKGKLIGRITADDIVDVLEEEQSEDMYQMAGLNKDEGVFDPILLSARRRIPWLTINLATAILAASVVGLFQGTIQRVVILAAYMPIVAGMGGNAATQTITVIVRALALKQVEYGQVWKVLIKEFFVGSMNGIILGILIGLISYVYNGQIMLGLVITFAMIINLMIAAISGTIIPLSLKWFRLDPALASSVLVTTCTDIGGFFAFLGLATILL